MHKKGRSIMTFQLKQLFHREGDTLPVDYEIPPQALSQIRGYRFDQPVHVTGTFRNRAGIVTLDLTVDCVLTAECDRCLELFVRPLPIRLFCPSIVITMNTLLHRMRSWMWMRSL